MDGPARAGSGDLAATTALLLGRRVAGAYDPAGRPSSIKLTALRVRQLGWTEHARPGRGHPSGHECDPRVRTLRGRRPPRDGTAGRPLSIGRGTSGKNRAE